jgi:hypothetical protein
MVPGLGALFSGLAFRPIPLNTGTRPACDTRCGSSNDTRVLVGASDNCACPTGRPRGSDRYAIDAGQEILEVMEIASVLGMHGVTSAVPILAELAGEDA